MIFGARETRFVRLSILGEAVTVYYEELYIRSQYDGKDLMSVCEIFYYDEDGDEAVCTKATMACHDIVTCADQGTDLWDWIKRQVEARLEASGISCRELYFADD
jgi:hypothetical protein